MRGQGLAAGVDGAAAQKQGLEREFMSVFFGNLFQDGDRGVRDFGTDPVARQHCDVFFHERASSERISPPALMIF